MNTLVLLTMPLTSHMLWMSVPTVSSDWKSHAISHCTYCELTNAVVLLMMTSVFPVLALHDKKVMLHLVSIILTQQKMVSLTMPSVWCDVHTGINSITWQKESCDTLFQFLHLMNKIIPLMMQLKSHDSNAGTNGTIWLKSHISPYFDHCDLINPMVPLTTPFTFQRYDML